MLTEEEATKEKAVEIEATVGGPQAASGRGERRLTEEAVAKKRQGQHERAGTEALCMDQTVNQVQGNAKANKGPETENGGVEVAAEAKEPQVGLGAAAEATEVTRLEVAVKAREEANKEVTKAEATGVG